MENETTMEERRMKQEQGRKTKTEISKIIKSSRRRTKTEERRRGKQEEDERRQARDENFDVPTFMISV